MIHAATDNIQLLNKIINRTNLLILLILYKQRLKYNTIMKQLV